MQAASAVFTNVARRRCGNWGSRMPGNEREQSCQNLSTDPVNTDNFDSIDSVLALKTSSL